MTQAAFEQLVDISLSVNGERVDARVPAGRHVVDLYCGTVLRQRFALVRPPF